MSLTLGDIDILTLGYSNNIVLFVDDEENILMSLKRGLRKEGYKKLFAVSGHEALELFEENEISVIVSDMRMPGMTGLELLKEVKEKYPDTVRIVLSAYTQLPQVLASINQADIFKFITKPWDLENGLKKIIREGLDYYNLNYENKLLKTSMAEGGVAASEGALSEKQRKKVQKDFEHVAELAHKMNTYIFEATQEQMLKKKDSLEIKEGVHNLTRIYKELSAILPLERTSLSMDEFAQHLSQQAYTIYYGDYNFDPESNRQNLYFRGVDKMTGFYTGHFALIRFVFKQIFETLFEKDSENLFNVVMRSASNEGFGDADSSRVVILLEESELYHKEETFKQRSVIYMLNTLLGHLLGGVKVAHHGNRVVVIVEFVLKSDT
jgi:CheY-like chemotaxis protein